MSTQLFLRRRLACCVAVLTLIASSVALLRADTVIVESRSGGSNFSKYSEDGGGFPNSWANSTAKSTAAGVTGGIGSRFNSNSGIGGSTTWFQVNPTLGTAGGVYNVYVTVSSASGNTAVTSTITQTGCTGLPETTDAFTVSASQPGNQWNLVGTITLDPGVNNPTIRFDETANGNRFYADAVKFQLASDVCGSVPQLSTVNGPLAAGQTFVDVPGIAAGVTNVTVYTSTGTKLGELTSGVVPGVNRVTTSPLVKGTQIIATQWKDGIESCKSTSGPKVGGGPNPSVKVVFNIREDTSLVGPIGIDGGTDGAYFFLGSANKTGGFGSSPTGGTVITPSTCWQTVTFQRGENPESPISPTYRWDVTTADTLDGDYGILDSIGFAIQDTTDTGPFAIYIDDIRNGDTVIQDFESAAVGTTAFTCSLPSANTAANTAANLLSPAPGTISPNISVIVDTNAASGTKSCLVNWQFNNSLNTTWEQLLLRGSGTPNPVVDLRLPISVHLLVLPVGNTTGHFLGDASVNNVTACSGDNAMFTATVVGGTGPFTYQWKRNGVNIPGATASSFTTNNVTTASAGTYSCLIGDGSGCTATPAGTLTVPAEVVIDSQPVSTGPVPGDGTGSASFSVSASSPCACDNFPALTYQWFFNGNPLPGATDASYFINNTYMTNGGSYTVLVSNTCNHGTLLSTPAKLYVYDPNVTPIFASCNGFSGLLGLYWTNQTSANAFTGAPFTTNNDSNVDFDWAALGPIFGFTVPTNNFVVRWVGKFQPYYPNQTYTFYTKSDDGVRLWVDGQLLIDKWVTQSSVEWSGSIALGSDPVEIVLEYFEQTGNASVQLSYDSLSVYKQVLPSSQLCAADPDTEIPPVTKLTSPTNNATAASGASVTLTANVAASSAPVNKVEFYNNGTNLLATINAPGPYSTSWMPAGVGVYNITARTYYNTTNKLNTPANKLTVNAPALASVNITGISGTSLNYTGGTGSKFVLLKSSSIATPRSSWARIATNATSPGSFTIPIGSETQAYYSVKSE